MLHIFRAKKFQRRTLIGIMILIIPAFVLWGAGSITKKPSIIGTIGEKKIYPDDFLESLKGMRVELLLTYYSNYDTFADLIKNRPLINRMAWERLVFLEAARPEKIKISDQDLLRYISSHPLFRRNGRFDNKVYNYVVSRTLAMETRDFEELVRENLMISTLQQNIYNASRVQTSEEDVKNLFYLLNNKLDISYVFVNKNDFSPKISPGKEEIKKYFEDNMDSFLEPDMIDLEYIAIEFNGSNDKSSKFDKMNAIYKDLLSSPAEFKKIAEKESLRYGKTGPVSRDSILPGIKFSENIHKSVFALDKGAITPPISSDGKSGEIYILRKISDIPKKIMPLSKVKEQIEKALEEEKKMDMSRELAQKIYESIDKDLVPLEQAAQNNNIILKTASGASLNSYLDDIGPAAKIVEKAHNKPAGTILEPIEVNNGYVIAHIDAVNEADDKLYQEQRDMLSKSIEQKERKKVLENWLKTKAPKTSLSQSLDKI